jgi:hypothetical protein
MCLKITGSGIPVTLVDLRVVLKLFTVFAGVCSNWWSPNAVFILKVLYLV